MLFVRVPLEIVFSEDAAEVDNETTAEDLEPGERLRSQEPKADESQIRAYVDSGAIVCDFDTEDHPQLIGAAIQSISLKVGQLEIFRP